MNAQHGTVGHLGVTVVSFGNRGTLLIQVTPGLSRSSGNRCPDPRRHPRAGGDVPKSGSGVGRLSRLRGNDQKSGCTPYSTLRYVRRWALPSVQILLHAGPLLRRLGGCLRFGAQQPVES